jgi:lysophospholipase L1-like esterase
MKDNKINNPLIIIGIALFFLVLNSYAPEGLEFFGQEIKQVDFLSDVRTENYYDTEEEEYYDEEEEYYDTEDEKLEDKEAENDSALLEGKPQYNLASLINFNILSEFVVAELNKFNNYYEVVSPVNGNQLTGNLSQLKSFFSALKQADKKQVRIAHFGDSAIEGDLITVDLRDLFQKKFGGTGVGIVPITSHDVQFRSSTDLSFSDDWMTASVYARNKEKLPIGIGGQVFVNAAGSWVNLKTNNRYKTVSSFDVAKLFYSNAKDNASIEYSLNRSKAVTTPLSGRKMLNVIEMRKDNSKEIKIVFPQNKTANYFGVSLESDNGVIVDNFALRGNTGVDLKKISTEYIKAFDNELNYKLVILEFGLNILSGNKNDFSRYEKNMIKVINTMKSALPNTSFLLVSAHDKCVKRGSKFITDPAVQKLIEAQENIAQKTDIAFWNLFEAMGGENSMIEWVDSNPPKAFRDYIHFNEVGAREEAEMLFKELMEKY